MSHSRRCRPFSLFCMAWRAIEQWCWAQRKSRRRSAREIQIVSEVDDTFPRNSFDAYLFSVNWSYSKGCLSPLSLLLGPMEPSFTTPPILMTVILSRKTRCGKSHSRNMWLLTNVLKINRKIYLCDSGGEALIVSTVGIVTDVYPDSTIYGRNYRYN